MTSARSSKIVYDFGPGERLEYEVLKARQVMVARGEPGIYAWFLRVPGNASDRIRQYSRLFSDKEITLDGETGRFSERFNGSLARVPPPIATQAIHSDLLARATAAFSPPLYIGISSDIRRRLRQHFRELEHVLWAGELPELPADIDEEDLDTAQESRTFGLRIASLLRRQGVRDTRWLFVKILYSDSCTRSELLSVEHALNHAFLPLCGLR